MKKITGTRLTYKVFRIKPTVESIKSPVHIIISLKRVTNVNG